MPAAHPAPSTPPPAAPAPSPDAHVAVAREFVGVRYPEALGAVLGGSCAQGGATERSDLDVSVLLPAGATSRRETHRHAGRPVEVFLNTVADLREAFVESRATRRATALFLFADSVVLRDTDGCARRLRAEARHLLDTGPDPLTPDERDAGRFLLTDLADDLADTASAGDRHEQLAVADRLLRESAHLLTAHRGAWNGAGKWLPRRLRAADPALAPALLDGHLAVAERADPGPLVTAAGQVLDLLGGPLREGYREVSPRQAARQAANAAHLP
ncbi:nucleotidyltransferase domain-containing protein [Streptomyces sp. 549]|uniref:nucleotidyltransferase domain-containing protein n=1 Tax=Streptomyces sp. 549 TaxID=3049076 RepID=UPI0024C3C67B|nr:nucleotidyltransferase domain-containing protein [Streptomyces sp. 549]MDK1472170.1 nucleotidyltransferase domain-containing protein [Streptomyces sp. 549]